MSQVNNSKAPGDRRILGRRICITGVVQGVGFRPYVYRLARETGVAGRVSNTGEGVIIDIEGTAEEVISFQRLLESQPPRLARIESISIEERPLSGFQTFEIIESAKGDRREALVPPDVALCDDCRREILDPSDRHFEYPFTNCTNCGPRFTIVKDLPYDRAMTSMSEFPMCEKCAREYHDPEDRRFHAQPVACPDCGPHVELLTPDGARIETADWKREVRRFLTGGQIVAIKGVGGFHLACDASNEGAVRLLRKRKARPGKPFAVMCRDLHTVEKYCFVSPGEREALESPAAPIVVLRSKQDSFLAPSIAPGMATIGVMLPYTPLHAMLFDDELDCLVMTSGNTSELPLVIDNEEALRSLSGIADVFLVHNREIVNRCDDSLVREIGGEVRQYRRSRGYVPVPFKVPLPFGVVAAPETPGLLLQRQRQDRDDVLRQSQDTAGAGSWAFLGCGAEMKNTFCLLKGDQAYMGQHIGEMEYAEAEDNYITSLERFQRLIDAKARVLGYDPHPGYNVSRIASELDAAARYPVWHHHAHMVSCMAENQMTGDVLGAILDGTGYGPDGNSWGFEILAGNYREFRRIAHLRYLPLPGGDACVKRPVRTALSYLKQTFPEEWESIARQLFAGTDGSRLDEELEIVKRLTASGINAPLASSAGRLFDAVSALLGICRANTYEGQAAAELGEIVAFETGTPEPYGFQLIHGDPLVIDPTIAVRSIVNDIRTGVPVERIALRFHRTVVRMVVRGITEAAQRTGLDRVVLSGGSFQNPYLLVETERELTAKGFKAFTQRLVPSNDGGLSLGQAVSAAWRWSQDVSGSAGQIGPDDR